MKRDKTGGEKRDVLEQVQAIQTRFGGVFPTKPVRQVSPSSNEFEHSFNYGFTVHQIDPCRQLVD